MIEGGHLVLGNGAADKEHDSLPLVLVLPVLQGQLGDLDRTGKVGGPLNVQALRKV